MTKTPGMAVFSRFGSSKWMSVATSLVVALVATCFVYPPKPTIHLIGDSTMADKPLVGNPERGWGQALPLFFRDGIPVANHARNGRSTKSFIDEGLWDDVLVSLQPGDFVLIQFGHNDAKKEDPKRFADADTDYKDNLRRYINESRKKGVAPILITPVVRRRFDDQGRFYDVHGRYPDAVREIGVEMDVPVIDLHKMSTELMEDLGAEGSKKLYLWTPPEIFSGFPHGRTDDTHFSWQGARAMASLVVQGIGELDLPLRDYLVASVPAPSVGIDKLVVLDYYYNSEWRKDKSSRIGRFHYVWEDTTNSGFSVLGTVIARLGAELDSLAQPPTIGNLRNASVYIIVDPDTPKETGSPQSIGKGEAADIELWVREGGILVLMANDSGNCEFQNLNRLAERFGITFNEDSHHRVRGTDYDVGRITNLPDHPMFAGVSNLFMKELSSLALTEPAKPVLSEGTLALMAESRFGRGLVVAVGDPWLYNEYIDNRRLPRGYENRPAAEAFFSWLLSEAKTVL